MCWYIVTLLLALWYIVSRLIAFDGPMKCCTVACTACNPIIMSYAVAYSDEWIWPWQLCDDFAFASKYNALDRCLCFFASHHHSVVLVNTFTGTAVLLQHTGYTKGVIYNWISIVIGACYVKFHFWICPFWHVTFARPYMKILFNVCSMLTSYVKKKLTFLDYF